MRSTWSLRTFLGGAAIAAVMLSAGPVEAQTPPPSGRDLIVLGTNPESGLSVDEMAPGDITEWVATVENVAGEPVPLTMEFGADNDAAQSPLTTDPVYGLQATVDTCTMPWTESVTGPTNARTFLCEGSQASLLGSTPVADLVAAPLQTGTELGVGGRFHTKVTMTFPRAAGNDFENLGGAVRVTFHASAPESPTTPGPGPTPDPPSKPRFPLPRTGSDLFALVAAGAGLLIGGAVIVAAVRRKDEDGLSDEEFEAELAALAAGTQATPDDA